MSSHKCPCQKQGCDRSEAKEPSFQQGTQHQCGRSRTRPMASSKACKSSVLTKPRALMNRCLSTARIAEERMPRLERVGCAGWNDIRADGQQSAGPRLDVLHPDIRKRALFIGLDLLVSQSWEHLEPLHLPMLRHVAEPFDANGFVFRVGRQFHGRGRFAYGFMRPEGEGAAREFMGGGLSRVRRG